MLNYRASGSTALRIHIVFVSVYVLLLIRALIFIFEGNPNWQNPPQNSVWSFAVKRLASEIYAPFWEVNLLSPWLAESPLFQFLIFSFFIYGLLHRGMFLKTTMQQENRNQTSFADRILQLCRAFFYFAGALLLLLILLRMCFMLYQDVAYGRPQLMIGRPAASPTR